MMEVINAAKRPAPLGAAEALLGGGLQTVKLRLGYATVAENLTVMRAVQARIPDGVQLMVN